MNFQMVGTTNQTKHVSEVQGIYKQAFEKSEQVKDQFYKTQLKVRLLFLLVFVIG